MLNIYCSSTDLINDPWNFCGLISGNFHPVILSRHIGPEMLKSIKSHVMCNSQCLKTTNQNNNKWYGSTLSHLLPQKGLKHNKNTSSTPTPVRSRERWLAKQAVNRPWGAKPAAWNSDLPKQAKLRRFFLGKSSYPDFCDPPHIDQKSSSISWI